jgi:hypothetical protein
MKVALASGGLFVSNLSDPDIFESCLNLAKMAELIKTTNNLVLMSAAWADKHRPTSVNCLLSLSPAQKD